MSLLVKQPELEVERIVSFLTELYQSHAKQRAVVAVSGGIDSALSLTLVSRALGPNQVTPVFLPYGTQSTADSKTVAEFCQIPTQNWVEYDIQPVVDRTAAMVEVSAQDRVRRGNIMARTRMILLYDVAKRVGGLVCGTENKSEKYLGYFTRFGDEASDVEPIQHLYKTQVRQLAEFLHVPEQILNKPPSAGLWDHQTDETEFGFSYEVADQVLAQLVDEHQHPEAIRVAGVESTVVQLILDRVEQNRFKHHVPYVVEEA